MFPIIYTLLVSFQNINMLEEDTSFSGLDALRCPMFGDGSALALDPAHLIFTAIALPIELILGLAMAYLFLDRMPGRQIFIALLVLPVMISPIVAGATWRLLVRQSLRSDQPDPGLDHRRDTQVRSSGLVNPDFVYPAILIAEIWQWTPFMFLLLLAGLSNVDQSQLEAAEIDGAGWWRTFWKIVLPSIRPVLAIALLIRALDLVRLFDVVWALTKGGPGTMTETISIYAYVQGFQAVRNQLHRRHRCHDHHSPVTWS